MVGNRPLASDVQELTLEPLAPRGEPFRAGQYLLLGSDGGLRPLSIASSPHRPDRLELCFRWKPEGKVTPRLAALRPGAVVEYVGPVGGFRLREGDARRLFVATGTGISPLRSMILDLLERGDTTGDWLVFGNRSRGDAIYLEEFNDLARRHRHFRFIPCLSRPDRGWRGECGRVTDVLPRVLEDASGFSAYICGRPEMVQDVTRLLGVLGIPLDRCHREP